MPIYLAWETNEKRVLHQHFVGAWSLQDMIETVDQTFAMIEQQEHAVSIIADFSASDRAPAQILVAAQHASRTLPHNLVCGVVISTSSTFNVLIRSVRTLFPVLRHHLYLASDEDAAREIVTRASHLSSS